MRLWNGLAFAVTALILLRPLPSLADEPELSAEEFKLWKDYKNALEDPRVQKKTEAQKLPAIAKNFKVPEKTLRAAVARGDQIGSEAASRCERRLKESLDGTALGGRLVEVRVDASESHAVGYVHWIVDQPEKLEQEAALVAVRAQKAAPIVSTVALWASAPGQKDTKVFEALIYADKAKNIKEERIVDFAHTRYIKLFDNVKNSYPATAP